MGARYVGAAVARVEDPRYLRGEARYVDDIKLPGLLHAAFLRSPHAHARFRGVDTARAAAMPGVVRVFTFADLEPFLKPLPVFGAPPPGLAERIRFTIRPTVQYALGPGIARYAGEIVAMVVADSRARAEDAAEALEVEWEPLPAVVEMVAAARPDPRGRPRRRRGLRHQGRGLPGGRAHPDRRPRARPAREVERGSTRAHDGRGPRPAPGARDRPRRAPRRGDPRRPRSHLARPRRLQRLGHRPPVQHGRPPPRAVPHPQPAGGGRGGRHQQDPQRPVPRGGSAGERLRDGPARRLARAADRRGPRGGPPAVA